MNRHERSRKHGTAETSGLRNLSNGLPSGCRTRMEVWVDWADERITVGYNSTYVDIERVSYGGEIERRGGYILWPATLLTVRAVHNCVQEKHIHVRVFVEATCRFDPQRAPMLSRHFRYRDPLRSTSGRTATTCCPPTARSSI